jgi:ATP-dependent DNA helicase RecG
LTGIGPKRGADLEGHGLSTLGDLLFHLPFRYEDRRIITSVDALQPGTEASAVVEVVRLSVPRRPWGRRGRGRVEGLVEAVARDATGTVTLVWFNNTRYVLAQCQSGRRLLVHGRVEAGPRIVHPEIDVLPSGDEREGPQDGTPEERGTSELEALTAVRPVYSRPGGVSPGLMRRFARAALDTCDGDLGGMLPDDVVRRLGLMDLREALAYAHAPPRDADIEALNDGTTRAQRTLIFDELFCFQLALGARRAEAAASPGITFRVPAPRAEALRRQLPFALTRAQERVVNEIYQDMMRPRPMRRLVQGDVGSGKTLVALLAAMVAVDSGYSAAVMVPTEVLAEQHVGTFRRLLRPLGIDPLLLTAGTTRQARTAALDALASGTPQLVVGTHALIQAPVMVARLGLVVVDEQHRFGVLQRERLVAKASGQGGARGEVPDALVMTATPIPRTLALAVYGDLDVSHVDELPPGRLAIATRVLPSGRRDEACARARAALREGEQVFVVFPLVEESEHVALRAAAAEMDELRGVFAGYSIELLHGRMASAEKERVMRGFVDGTFRVLACTSVIEVGIDVPNATVMIVEHADRFGLAQLHQLRGRVGRGSAASACYLIASADCPGEGYERLRVMERTQDGFRIAEADLRIRGPGELLGTRQAGLPAFRVASLLRDARLLEAAREEARRFLARQPGLASSAAVLRTIDRYRWARHIEAS